MAVAVLTAFVVLVRAGGASDDAANWLVQWELRSSDNGVLFQFFQDATSGRAMDWVFSPQVYVFPELPISAAAYALSGGGVYGYYVVVAVLNNALLYVTLVGLVRVLHPRARPVESAVRAALASLPLLVLPLIGTSWIFSFHLAPSYYLGMYVALLAAPIVLLTRSRAVRLSLAIALALTAASDPLTLVFAAPGALAAVLLLLRRGWRVALRPAVGLAVLLIVTAGLRTLFTPLQGTSPLTYVDPAVFSARLAAILPYYRYQALDAAAAVILVIGAVLAVVALAAAVVAAVLFWRRRAGERNDGRLLAVVYLGLIPLGGLGATLLIMITHYLYFWPVLVLPMVLALLAIPRVALPVVGVAAATTFSAVAISTGLVAGDLATIDHYVGYRNAETRCIVGAVPTGSVGYATFSDARRLSLTSSGGFRLLQLFPDVTPHDWLSNRAAVRTEGGSFFYVNGSGDELPLDTGVLRREFGEPDSVVTCSGTQSVWRYTDAAKLRRIAAFFAG